MGVWIQDGVHFLAFKSISYKGRPHMYLEIHGWGCLWSNTYMSNLRTLHWADITVTSTLTGFLNKVPMSGICTKGIGLSSSMAARRLDSLTVSLELLQWITGIGSTFLLFAGCKKQTGLYFKGALQQFVKY